MNRIYVIGSLPRLEFGAKPDTTTTNMMELFEINFSGRELKDFRIIRLWIDLNNIYRLLYNDNLFDRRGNYVKATLKAFMDTEEELPNYVFEFFADYPSMEERKRNFSKLIVTYFQEEKKKASANLKPFLQFEHDFRVIITAFRAKKTNEDMIDALKFEDPTDPIVQMALVQNQSPGPFMFPYEYAELEGVIAEAGVNPTKQFMALAKYRFDHYAEIEFESPFGMNRVLAYLLQLMQLEEVFALRVEEGEERLKKLVENEHAS